jgi:hypothetical protein
MAVPSMLLVHGQMSYELARMYIVEDWRTGK